MFSKPIYNSPLCSCIICKHVTSAKGIHSHHRVVHSEDGKKSHAEASKKGSVAGALATSKKYKQLKDAEINSYEKSPNSCEQCGIHLSFESRHNRFVLNLVLPQIQILVDINPMKQNKKFQVV